MGWLTEPLTGGSHVWMAGTFLQEAPMDPRTWGSLRKEVPVHSPGPGWWGAHYVRLWVITISLPLHTPNSLSDYSLISSHCNVSRGYFLPFKAEA